jgi:hypothetical protein
LAQEAAGFMEEEQEESKPKRLAIVYLILKTASLSCDLNNTHKYTYIKIP